MEECNVRGVPRLVRVLWSLSLVHTCSIEQSMEVTAIVCRFLSSLRGRAESAGDQKVSVSETL
jgi:hypothetical protein